jgi:VWFA-related protein
LTPVSRALLLLLTLAMVLPGSAVSTQGVTGAAPPELPEPQVIHIDAVVSDARRRPIENLRAEDFEILEDGVARPIEAVRFVHVHDTRPIADTSAPIATRIDEQAAAAQDGVRLFAIFLDEYHVAPGDGVARARLALTRFVDDALGPRDLALVVKPLDSLLSLRMTRDRRQLLEIIAGFEGRKGQYEPRNAFEQDLIAGTPQRIEALRGQIAVSALNALATHLGGLGAVRKSMIVVSEGFTRAARRRGDEALPSIDTVIRTANRGNVSIHPFDPAAGPVAPSPARDLLQTLAGQTDGRAILDAADPFAELSRLADDSEAYYLISFRSGNLTADGRFRAVTVRVRQPKATVTARRGFWAPTADDVLRARLLARANEPKPPPEPPRRISPLIRPWFGVARGAAGSTQVSFVWEPAGRVPGDRTRPPAVAKITLKATRPDGSSVFEGVVRPAGAAAVGAAGGDPVRAVFETAPGRLRLQMRIEDAASRLIDTDVRDLIVSPLNRAVTLGTAEVIRARSAREYRSLEGDADAVPTSAREFSRSERLLIRVPAYAAGPDLAVTARLASRAGGSMRDLVVVKGPAPHLFQVDLPLAGLASGAYAVQFTVKSPDGDAKDEVAFRVTP